MLTFFCTPKAFQGHNAIIQTNALQSWVRICPSCEILMIGNDPGVAEFASSHSLRHIPDVTCNQYGTPLVSSIFQVAQEAAVNDMLCYMNADIMLCSDFIDAVRRIPSERSLGIGRRWDLDIDELIDFSDEQWEFRVRSLLGEKGVLHQVNGMDYFVFRKGLYADMPPLALGRSAWDNWIVFNARLHGLQVVDMTPVTTAVHQNHDYSHIPGEKEAAFKGVEALENQRLLGGWEHSFNISHATHVLTAEGLKPNTSFIHMKTCLETIPVLHRRLRFLRVFTVTKKVVLEYISNLFRGK